MSTRTLTKFGEPIPTVFDDILRPRSEWFENGGNVMGRTMNVPAVNIIVHDDEY